MASALRMMSATSSTLCRVPSARMKVTSNRPNLAQENALERFLEVKGAGWDVRIVAAAALGMTKTCLARTADPGHTPGAANLNVRPAMVTWSNHDLSWVQMVKLIIGEPMTMMSAASSWVISRSESSTA